MSNVRVVRAERRCAATDARRHPAGRHVRLRAGADRLRRGGGRAGAAGGAPGGGRRRRGPSPALLRLQRPAAPRRRRRSPRPATPSSSNPRRARQGRARAARRRARRTRSPPPGGRGRRRAAGQGARDPAKVATAERQHAEAIIYSISDAVLVTDPFDELVLANESAARTFEFDLRRRGAHAGRPARSATRRSIELIREMRQARRPGRPADRRAPGAARRTRPRRSRSRSRCVADARRARRRGQCADADAAGVVAVLHDMTHEKGVAEMKNDFVSNVSHELRTPLASIKAYVEMLIDGEARRREDQARVLRGHPERGQPPRPADRQHPEHLPRSSRAW